MGVLDKALWSYEQALMIFEQIGSRLSLSNVYQDIGNISVEIGKPNSAVAFYGRALEMLKTIGDIRGQSNVYLALARLNNDSKLFEKAIHLYELIGDIYSLGRSKYYFGIERINAGDRHRGLELLADSRRLWEQVGFNEGIQAVDDVLAQEKAS